MERIPRFVACLHLAFLPFCATARRNRMLDLSLPRFSNPRNSLALQHFSRFLSRHLRLDGFIISQKTEQNEQISKIAKSFFAPFHALFQIHPAAINIEYATKEE